MNKQKRVIELLKTDPNIKASAIAKVLDTTMGYTYTLMSKARKAMKKTKLPPPSGKQVVEEKKVEKVDNINHPPHYKVGGVETIDFIEAKGLDYHLGNVIKYITRADHKDNKLENLKKAQWYLNRAISNEEKTNG